MSRITLATPSEGFETRVRQALNGHLGNGDVVTWHGDFRPEEFEATVSAIAAAGTQVVTVGPDLDPNSAVRLALAFDRSHPEIDVLLVAPPSPPLVAAAMRAGVREVVAPDAPDDELRAALERALGTSSRRRANLLGEAPDVATGQVFVVMSPKGGAGKTTMAANLAVGLAKVAPKEVVIVDLDLQFGDVANVLRLSPEHTIADAVAAGAGLDAGLDATEAKIFLTAHPSGVYALCAPEEPAAADRVKPDAVGRLLGHLAQEFRYVVVDTGSGIDDFGLVALDHATDCILVCATDVPTVRGMRKAVQVLDLVGATRSRRTLVLNRSNARVGLAARDIESTVGLPVDVEVPSSRVVPLSTNQGSPVLESSEHTVATEAMADLVERVAGIRIPLPTRRRGMFGRRTDR